jgi:hypothetical protein
MTNFGSFIDIEKKIEESNFDIKIESVFSYFLKEHGYGKKDFECKIIKIIKNMEKIKMSNSLTCTHIPTTTNQHNVIKCYNCSIKWRCKTCTDVSLGKVYAEKNMSGPIKCSDCDMIIKARICVLCGLYKCDHHNGDHHNGDHHNGDHHNGDHHNGDHHNGGDH